MSLINLEKSIKELENKTASLKGRIDLLEEQFVASQSKLSELRDLQAVNKKAVELLNLVQQATKELVCNMFETIVTQALQFIHQNEDYFFKLDFGKRGNIPELDFSLRTPTMQNPHSILDTMAGGSSDIVSLALRFVLLEVSKTNGFLFVDEPEKHLDSPETVAKMIEFIKETQKNTNRQVIIISHKKEMCDNADNLITLE